MSTTKQIKIGINGFGRIGRGICRAVFERTDGKCVISGINSLKNPEYLAYLFKYVTEHGKFSGTETHTEESIIVKGHSIRIVTRNPSEIAWKSAGIEYACECTDFSQQQAASAHINI